MQGAVEMVADATFCTNQFTAKTILTTNICGLFLFAARADVAGILASSF
jgi:hypothetical protein